MDTHKSHKNNLGFIHEKFGLNFEIIRTSSIISLFPDTSNHSRNFSPFFAQNFLKILGIRKNSSSQSQKKTSLIEWYSVGCKLDTK